jgi:hypothetical protein
MREQNKTVRNSIEKSKRDTLGLTAAQVKARTGVRDFVMLLRFLLIVCDGDIELLVSRETALT